MKPFANSLEIKQKIIDYFKINRFKFYGIPDTITSMKVVIRGLPASMKPNDIDKTLAAEGLVIHKAVQMINRKDKRILPLFLLHLPREEHSQRIFKRRALFHFRIVIEVY